VQYQHVLVRRDGPVEYLTLNRPAVRNAFNKALVAELSDWADRVASDTRVVVLAGAGPTFCAGADVTWMTETLRYSKEENVRDATAMSDAFDRLDNLPLAVVGRIQGAALGGGSGLVSVCDIAIAADDAMFGFTEVRLGIVPAIISPFVVSKIGASAARELFLTGARFGAARALEIGLVHRVVPAESLDETVAAVVKDVLAAGPEAVATAKALIRQLLSEAATDVREMTARVNAERRMSAEGQEGLGAFLEKRKPSWAR
jgi:methylglutaconyl-CoA hydratase